MTGPETARLHDPQRGVELGKKFIKKHTHIYARKKTIADLPFLERKLRRACCRPSERRPSLPALSHCRQAIFRFFNRQNNIFGKSSTNQITL